MKKSLIVVIVIAAVIVVTVAAVLIFHKAPPAPQTYTLKKRTITETVTAVGNMVPKHIITVRSALDGNVTKMYKNIGDQVKKGDSLALVGPNVAPSTLAQAINNVATQKVKVLGDKKLVENDRTLIKYKLATANYSTYISDLSTLKQDEAMLKYYNQVLGLTQYGKATIAGKLEKGQVVSPIDGYILQRNVDVGDSIISLSSNQSATNLFTIADMQEMVFKGAVDQLDADKLKVGMKASISVGPLEGKKISGTLLALGLQSNQENEKFSSSSSSSSNTSSPFNVGFQVKVGDLVLPKGKTLRSGFSATASFTTKVYKNVPTLPQSVVHFTQTGAYVMLFQGDKKPGKKTTIKVGASNGSYVQVLSGLKATDQVIQKTGSV